MEIDAPPARSRSRQVRFTVGRLEFRPARLIYGSIVLVSLLGLLAKDASTTSVEGMTLIVGASLALYVSHCFSEAVGMRLDVGRRLTRTERTHILTEELSVVALSVMPVALLLCAQVGLLGTETALRVSMWGGIGFLAMAGWALGEAGRMPIMSRLLSATLCAALGTAIVLLELLLAH